MVGPYEARPTLGFALVVSFSKTKKPGSTKGLKRKFRNQFSYEKGFK